MSKITVDYEKALAQLISMATRDTAIATTHLIGRALSDAARQQWPLEQLEGVISGMVFMAVNDAAGIGVNAFMELDSLDDLDGMEV